MTDHEALRKEWDRLATAYLTSGDDELRQQYLELGPKDA